MKMYKISVKLSNEQIFNPMIDDEYVLYNNDITKIIDLLKQRIDNFTSVLRQALEQKDQVLINVLIGALVEAKLMKSKHEIKKIVSNDDYEIIRLITTYGYIDILNKLLEITPSKKKSKTFILKLVTIAAVNRHAGVVCHLIKTLFPR